MVLKKSGPEAMGCGTHMDIIIVNGDRGIYTGTGPELVFQIEQQVFPDGQAGREADGIPVDDGFSVGPCTGSSEIGASACVQGLRHKDPPDQLLHFLPLKGQGTDRISRRSLPCDVFGKIKQQQVFILMDFFGDQAQEIFGNEVIGINKYDPFSVTMVQTGVSCGGNALIFLMDDFDAAVLPGIFFAYGRTAVGGTVVDQKDFKIITGRM